MEKQFFNKERIFIIAEISGNHLQDIEKAKQLIKKSFEAGVDAVKIQTYTPNTVSMNLDEVNQKIIKKYHTVEINQPDWKGMNYNELYKKVYTPWDWHSELNALAEDCGLILFSTPNDFTAVDYLEQQNVTIYKLASYDLINIPLIKKVAQTKKPVIMSVGMATEQEISEAVKTLTENGCPEIALLHCISSYPAKTDELNLSKIQDLKEKYPNCIIGFSDHSLDINTPAMAVGLGAKIIERHICLDRGLGGPDASFSLEPHEFIEFIEKVRKKENTNPTFEELKQSFPTLEIAYGKPEYGPTNEFEKSGIDARPSIWINKDIKQGEKITHEHLKIVRPGKGLKPKCLEKVIGKKAAKDLEKGLPLTSDSILDI